MEGSLVDNGNNDKKKGVKKGFKSGKNVIKISKGKKPNSKRKRFMGKGRATIYIGHIPHGFYENEMIGYFSQFGKVLGAKVARSKKTGRSKSFGFVEFANEEVAKIAAESMNNYLMFNKIIKCSYIPPEERKKKFLRLIDQNDYPRLRNRKKMTAEKINSVEKLDQKTYLKKTQSKINAFKRFFEEKGISFNFKFDASNSQDEKGGQTLKNDSLSTTTPQSGGESEEQFGVLEIDESDNEIHFKTPPQVKKVIKRSLDSPVGPSKKFKAGKSKPEKQSLKTSGKSSRTKLPQKKEEGKQKSNKDKSKLLSVKLAQVKTTQKTTVQKKGKSKTQGVGKSPEKKKQKPGKVVPSRVKKVKV